MPNTGKKINKNITQKTGKNLIGWEVALEAARKRLIDNKLQAAKLRAAIRLFSDKLAKGEPWPGDEQQKAPAEAGAEMGEK